jgi:hypothetical protein
VSSGVGLADSNEIVKVDNEIEVDGNEYSFFPSFVSLKLCNNSSLDVVMGRLDDEKAEEVMVRYSHCTYR